MMFLANARHAVSLALFSAVVLGGASSCLEAQKTWTVQGDQWQFSRVIAQVNHGDTVLVRQGRYDGTTIEKAVTIVCDPGVVFLRAGSHGGGGIAFYQIPRDRTARMIGGSIAWYAVVSDCPGNVVFEGFRANILNVRRSAAVSFNRCAFGNSAITESTASFSDCSLQGAGCTQRPSLGCGALTMRNSNVVVGGGTVTGADKVLFLASPGVYMESGQLTVAGGTKIRGGASDGNAIWARSGAVRLGTNVQLLVSGARAIRGNATVIRDHYPSVKSAGVSSGDQFSMDLIGQPGSLVWAFASLPVQPTLTPLGMLWTSLPMGFTVDRGIVPAGGSRRTSFLMPPTPRGIAVALQPLALTPGGTFLFGAPATVITR